MFVFMDRNLGGVKLGMYIIACKINFISFDVKTKYFGL